LTPKLFFGVDEDVVHGVAVEPAGGGGGNIFCDRFHAEEGRALPRPPPLSPPPPLSSPLVSDEADV
jgi:hypothetical protein